MSRELQDILGILRRGPGPFALATLVKVEGASYRRPGARLLLDRQGPLRGSLSGGCLEADLHARAQEVMAEGRPRRVQYDLRGDADLVWGTGSGCEGVLDVLLEPISAFPEWMGWVELAWAARTSLVLHTDLSETRLASRCLPGDADPETAGEIWSEVFEPPIALWVLGAGDDSRPLVRMAASLGWHVGVLDHRPAFARPDRFPEAHTVRAGQPTAVLPALPLDSRSAVVLMTHHYSKDLESLRVLLPSSAGYLGLMGSRRRSGKLLAELAAEDLKPDDRLHTPVGLDLGATEPEGIALAILAEIHAVLAGASGRPLGARPSESQSP